MISQKSEALKEFFMKELVELIDKYNKLDEELVRKVESIIECVRDKEVKNRLLSNLDEVVELAKSMDEEVDEDLVQFYFAVKQQITEISIGEATILWDRLSNDGHTMIQAEDIVIYSDESNLREYIEKRIDDIVRDSYELDRLFDKDTIIDYFLEEISPDEVARELLENAHEYEEILDIDAEFLFEDCQGRRYHYGMLSV